MLLDRRAAARASHAQQIWNYANEGRDLRWPFVQANVHATCEATLQGPRKAFHLLNCINPICASLPRMHCGPIGGVRLHIGESKEERTVFRVRVLTVSEHSHSLS